MRPVAPLALAAALSAQADPKVDAPAFPDAVHGAARWLRSVAVRSADGTRWPADPTKPESLPANLYSGSTGVVLFWLGLHRATAGGDPAALAEARAGADALLADLDRTRGAGLYTGLAGLGFTLQQVARDVDEPRYREGAMDCLRRITSLARADDDAVAWGPIDDVVSGTAGVGLYLLDAADALEQPAARALAVAAGRGLLRRAVEAEGGQRWAMSPTRARDMPNFSHGTAGIAYFLGRLHEVTGDTVFRDAAVAGGRHLLALADREAGRCRVHHHSPGGEQLFYMGWCHGPVGTARLFHLLDRIAPDGDDDWGAWVERCAATVMASGIPRERLPGYWNNVGICCGAAGIVAFFADLHRAADGRDDYLRFAREVAADVIARATRDDAGSRWVQAEHRVQPDLLIAQTGYMQGAAGVGLALLRLEARGDALGLRLPDDPFGR